MFIWRGTERPRHIPGFFKTFAAASHLFINNNMKIRNILEATYFNKSIDLAENPNREGFQQQVRAAWFDNLLYKGQNVHQMIYKGGIAKQAEDYLRKYNDRMRIEDFDSQEIYLGYVPDDDVFIQGFDTWAADNDSENDDDNGEENYPIEEAETYNTVHYRIKDGKVSKFFIGGPGRMMYPKTLRHLHSAYPSLLDIRLA